MAHRIIYANRFTIEYMGANQIGSKTKVNDARLDDAIASWLKNLSSVEFVK